MYEVTAAKIVELLKIWEMPESLDIQPAPHKFYGLYEGLQTPEVYKKYLNDIGDAEKLRSQMELTLEPERQAKEVNKLFAECKQGFPFVYDFYLEKKSEVWGEERPLSMIDLQKEALKRILLNYRGSCSEALEWIEKKFAAIYADIMGQTPLETKHTYKQEAYEMIMEKLHWTAAHDSKYYHDYLVDTATGLLNKESQEKREEADRVMGKAETRYPYIYRYYKLKNRDYLIFHSLTGLTFMLECAVDSLLSECKKPAAEKLDIINKDLGNIISEKKQEKTAEGSKKPVKKRSPLKKAKSKIIKKSLNKGEVIEIIFDNGNWRYRLSAQGFNQQPLKLSPNNKEYLFIVMSYFIKRDLKPGSTYDSDEYDTISMVIQERDPKASHYDNRLREQLKDRIDYELPDKPIQWLRGKKQYKLNGIVFKDNKAASEGHSRYVDNINRQEEEE